MRLTQLSCMCLGSCVLGQLSHKNILVIQDRDQFTLQQFVGPAFQIISKVSLRCYLSWTVQEKLISSFNDGILAPLYLEISFSIAFLIISASVLQQSHFARSIQIHYFMS